MHAHKLTTEIRGSRSTVLRAVSDPRGHVRHLVPLYSVILLKRIWACRQKTIQGFDPRESETDHGQPEIDDSEPELDDNEP